MGVVPNLLKQRMEMYSSYFEILFLGGKDRKKGFQRGAKKNEQMKKILISG